MDDDVEAMHVVFCPFSLLLSLCVLIVVRVYQTPIIAIITANEHTHTHTHMFFTNTLSSSGARSRTDMS